MTIPADKFEELNRRIDEAGLLSETEAEEVRLLLRRWRRINVFFDGLGWVGSNLARLAVWIGVMWGALELFLRNRP